MGCVQSQVRLVRTLEAYESAERAAGLCPWNRAQSAKADRIYTALVEIALACGFEPGRQHAHLSTLQWSKERVAVIQRVFPIHLRESGR